MYDRSHHNMILDQINQCNLKIISLHGENAGVLTHPVRILKSIESRSIRKIFISSFFIS
jgi:hypothetical protein